MRKTPRARFRSFRRAVCVGLVQSTFDIVALLNRLIPRRSVFRAAAWNALQDIDVSRVNTLI